MSKEESENVQTFKLFNIREWLQKSCEINKSKRIRVGGWVKNKS